MASLQFSTSFDDHGDDAIPVLQSDPFHDPSVSPELVSTDGNDDEIATLQQQVEAETGAQQKAKSTPKVVPDGRPKRPLSGYNVFFKLQRQRIISGQEDKEITAEDVENFEIDTAPPDKTKKRRHRKTHGKIGFRELARKIADKWKRLDPECKVVFEDRASIERSRYLRELDAWKKETAQKKTENDKECEDSDATAFDAGMVEYGAMEDVVNFNQTTQKQDQHELLMNGMHDMQNMMANREEMPSPNQYQHPQMPFAGDYYNVANQTYNLVQSAVPNAFGQQASHPFRGNFGQSHLSLDFLNPLPVQATTSHQGNNAPGIVGFGGLHQTQKQAQQQLSLQKLIMQQQSLHQLLQQRHQAVQARIQSNRPRTTLTPLVPDNGGMPFSGAVDPHQGLASPSTFEDQNPGQNDEVGDAMRSVFEAFL